MLHLVNLLSSKQVSGRITQELSFASNRCDPGDRCGFALACAAGTLQDRRIGGLGVPRS